VADKPCQAIERGWFVTIKVDLLHHFTFWNIQLSKLQLTVSSLTEVYSGRGNSLHSLILDQTETKVSKVVFLRKCDCS
jgi:hypothetical protein